MTVTTDGHGSATADPASAEEGEEITLKATPDSGYEFSNWEVVSGGVTLADPTNPTTTFDMGPQDVEVKAYFVKSDGSDPRPFPRPHRRHDDDDDDSGSEEPARAATVNPDALFAQPEKAYPGLTKALAGSVTLPS